VITEPAVGTIGVVSTLHAGTWFDRFVSWVIQFDTQSPVNHAFVYIGRGRILEARPGGSGFNRYDAYPGTLWLTHIQPPGSSAAEQEAVAESLCGIPYGWLDIAAIGIAQKRWSPETRQRWLDGREPWWVRRIATDPRDAICSQLCDLYYLHFARHLFNDKRLPGLVSPGDLLTLDRSLVPARTI
jgi:hypothetical protein